MESLYKTVVRAIVTIHNEDYCYPFQDINPQGMLPNCNARTNDWLHYGYLIRL